MGYKVSVNKTRCIASGDCAETAPTVFQLDADGKADVINATGAPDNVLMSAARGCPAKAITVTDAESGAQLFPTPKK